MYSLSSSLWNLFLRVDLELLVFSSDLSSCGACLDKVQEVSMRVLREELSPYVCQLFLCCHVVDGDLSVLD